MVAISAPVRMQTGEVPAAWGLVHHKVWNRVYCSEMFRRDDSRGAGMSGQELSAGKIVGA
jgi:hypothetical protein